MDTTYGRGGVTTNEDVLRNFLTNSDEVKANNLSTHYDSYNDQVLLRQYGTLIATRKGDKVMITAKRYSVTTSKVQNELLRLAMEYGLDVQKTNEFAKGGMSKKCEVGDNVFVKSKGLSGLVSRVNGEKCYVKFGGNLTKHDGTYNMNDIEIEESSLFYDEYAKGGKMKSLNDGLEVYAQNKQQLDVIKDIIPILDKKGIKLRFGAYVGKSPQSIIFDKEYQDGALRISGNGFDSNYLPSWYGDEFSDAEEFEYVIDNPSDEYAKGGDVAKGNYEMMLIQAKEVAHHVKELQNILKSEKNIDAWVVAKMENVTSDLSEITHYLDGKTEFAYGGKMSRGGYFGKSAVVKDLDDEFASEELLAKFRKKSGIKDTQLKKPNVIAFAYTDYGGDFMDKVVIEYFLENYPRNIVVENSAYNGKNAIVWGKPAIEWVETTEDYPFGFEDFETFYYDKVYKEEETAFSEYLYELQRDGYELDYDEVLSWLLENKGGYYSVTTQGLDFYADDLTKELLEEGLIEKEEEYARGGKTKGVEWVVNFTNELDRGDYVTKYVIANSESEAINKGYMEISEDGEESDDYQLSSVYKLSSVKMAKGGNIKSNTNKKMATKKSKDGQSAPQTKRWIFAYKKDGYNYYNHEERPYKKPIDSDKKGAPVGYRFSKYAEEKGITNNRFRKPTKAEVEQYAGKKKNGKLIMYRESRSNKSDVNPKKKI